MPFNFKKFDDMPDVVLIEPRAFGDDRGWFMETFKKSEFDAHGIPVNFDQDNHSFSAAQGTLRGLHYQKHPMAQGKLVRCTRGEIFDVVVDIRHGSPTRGKWISVVLSPENRRILWIPAGFAHGFCTTKPDTEVVYKATHEYSPENDRSVRFDDPQIGVRWPAGPHTLSKKDIDAPLLANADINFTWSEHK